MNKKTLLLALLFSAPLAAEDYESACAKIRTAQGLVDKCKSKVERLRDRVEAGHKVTQDMTGKSEYADDMESRKKGVEQTIDEHNKAISELGQAVDRLKMAISEVGKQYQVVETSGQYSVVKSDDKPLEPIVTQKPVEVQRSYGRTTRTYAR